MIAKPEGNAGLRTVPISDDERTNLIQKLLLMPGLGAALLGLLTSECLCSSRHVLFAFTSDEEANMTHLLAFHC